jgi:hypothetical protein
MLRALGASEAFRYFRAMSDMPPNFERARMIATLFALSLTLGIGWEIDSGVAIHKTGGPSYRAIHPGLYWFEVAYQGLIAAFVIWFVIRVWRSR